MKRILNLNVITLFCSSFIYIFYEGELLEVMLYQISDMLIVWSSHMLLE